MSSLDLYATVTEQIVAMPEAGVVPWRSPILGRSTAGHPKNLNTGRQYRGVKVFLLALAEMSAAFLCSQAAIQPAVIGNQAAYVSGWLKPIKADKKLVISATGNA